MEQRFDLLWDGGAAAPLAARRTIEADTAVVSEVTLAGGAEGTYAIAWNNHVNALKGICITVEGNDDGTVTIDYNANPSQRLTFPAGGGEVFWTHRFARSRPVSGVTLNVQNIYITNNATTPATVRIRVLSNSKYA